MPFISNPLSKTANVRRGLRALPVVNQIAQQLDVATARAIVDMVIMHNLGPAIAGPQTYAQIFVGADVLFGIELGNIVTAKFRIAGLMTRMTMMHNMMPMVIAPGGGGAVPPNQRDPALYHAAVGDSLETLAAKWLCYGSNALGAAFVNVIRDTLVWLRQNNVPVNTMAGLQQINHLIGVGGGVVPAYRAIVPGSNITSSIAGEWLLRRGLASIAATVPGAGGITHGDYACYLLGMIIRAHGFTDGNGRAARAAYALAMFNAVPNIPFIAPNPLFEQTLHGL